MLILKAFRFRLVPTQEQEALFRQCCGVARYAWNWTLGTCKREYETALEAAKARDDFKIIKGRDGKERKRYNAKAPAINRGRLYKALCEHRETDARWLREYHSHVYAYPVEDVCKAYKAWWREVKKGRRHGGPRFKTKGQAQDSFRIQINARMIDKGCVRIPGIGWVKCRRDPQLRIGDGTPLAVTVRRVADRWMASVAAKVEIPAPDPSAKPHKVLGVDLGVNALVTLSDGSAVAPPECLERKLRQLARRSRQLSRKQKGSKRRERAKMRLARLHAEIADARADFLHKLSRRLVGDASVVAVEGFDVQKLLGVVERRDRRRKISDAAWGEFRRQLNYKGEWYGSDIVVMDEFDPTDMQCHRCGTKNKMAPTTSTYRCSSCKLKTTRQRNTALLLQSFGEGNPPEGTPGQGGTDARGVDGSAAGQEPDRNQPRGSVNGSSPAPGESDLAGVSGTYANARKTGPSSRPRPRAGRPGDKEAKRATGERSKGPPQQPISR